MYSMCNIVRCIMYWTVKYYEIKIRRAIFINSISFLQNQLLVFVNQLRLNASIDQSVRLHDIVEMKNDYASTSLIGVVWP